MDAFLTEQETKLMAKKEEIEKEIQKFSCSNGPQEDNDQKVCFPDYGKEEQDNAEEVGEYQTKVSLMGQLEENLVDVELALKKIKDGSSYGICEKCQQPISKDRLSLKPEARQCVQCIS